jgi:hypothetical protein
MNTIREFAEKIANNLQIKKEIIINEINDDLLDRNIDSALEGKFTELLQTDINIQIFGSQQELNDNDNFIELKNNLGRLQLLVLIKNLNKAENCADVLNAFMNVMNTKIETINEVLRSNIQSGGNQIDYYQKYKKYKKKYTIIKNM